MQIEQGLFDHMVLQRARGGSDACFSGACANDGPVEIRVAAVSPRRGKACSGDLDGKWAKWRRVGIARRRRFAGRLQGLPPGGPYDVEVRIGPEAGHVKQVLVGDVWILAGQSNMQGCGNLCDATPDNPLVRAFYMIDRWGVARDPIHNLHEAVDPVHLGGVPLTNKGIGPGIPFANAMHDATGVPQGLIACAHGGTTMAQWDPAKKKLGGHSLYGAMLRRFRKNGGRVAGVLWYQGESDANPEAAAVYTPAMKTLIRAFRRDLCDPALPVAFVQIGRYIGEPLSFTAWNSIQEQQRLLAAKLPRVAMVPAIDLQLDDGIHVGGRDMRVLGGRLAQAVRAIRKEKGAREPIALAGIELRRRDGWPESEIRVRFSNVVGRLRAGGVPRGFDITDGAAARPCIYDVRLDGDTAILHSQQLPTYFGDKALHYGLGVNPFCNITDEAGRPVPVFGPVRLGTPRALTPFVRTVRVSRVFPGAGKLHDVALPAADADMQWSTRTFPSDFLDIHQDLFQPGKDALVWYACAFECPEPMRLALSLGYDGPVKAWMDGAEVFHDPDGTNPAVADDRFATCDGRAGRHEVVIALGSNTGRAWGVFLRFVRHDVPRRMLQTVPGTWVMPRPLEGEAGSR